MHGIRIGNQHDGAQVVCSLGDAFADRRASDNQHAPAPGDDPW